MYDRFRLTLLALAVSFAMGGAVSAATSYNKPQRQDQENARAQADPSAADTSAAAVPLLADRVIVRKSERRLYLMHGNSVLRSYRVALGLNPVGPKVQEGDSRTPEGHYPPQSAQRILPVHHGVLPQRPGFAACAAQSAHPGRGDHDPRVAQRTAS